MRFKGLVEQSSVPHPARMTTQYFTLGHTGLAVSRLALGTMTFGTEWGWGTDRTTAESLVDAYLEAGGNLFDTADLYTGGTSERWLGEMIAARGNRDRVVIATKAGFGAEAGNPNAGGHGRKNIMRAVEGSLRRLGTDYIDLYLVHAWDRLTSADETVRTLDDLVRAGKVRHVGFSNVPAWFAARAQAIAELRGWEAPAALQLEYSLLERGIEHELLPLGLRHGMGVMAWSPLGSGMLSGKHRADGSGEGRLVAIKDSKNPAFAKLRVPRNWEIVAELERVASELGAPMARVALAWVLGRPGVATVIVGATKLPQLRDNLAALELELPPELRARLDRISAPVVPYPHDFLGAEIQSMIRSGTTVSDAPAGHRPRISSDDGLA